MPHSETVFVPAPEPVTLRTVRCAAFPANADLPSRGHTNVFVMDRALLTPHSGLLLPCLSPDEVARSARFVRPLDGERFSLFHGAVRCLLGAMVGRSPAALDFVADPAGKPHPGPSWSGAGLAFNLSHSGDLLALAVSRGADVGVDIEAVGRSLEADGIAERFFHPRERAVLAALPLHEREAQFLRWWVAKESLLKARGTGLAGGLDRVDLSAWRAGDTAAVAAGGGAATCVALAGEGWVGAVASSGPLHQVTVIAALSSAASE